MPSPGLPPPRVSVHDPLYDLLTSRYGARTDAYGRARMAVHGYPAYRPSVDSVGDPFRRPQSYPPSGPPGPLDARIPFGYSPMMSPGGAGAVAVPGLGAGGGGGLPRMDGGVSPWVAAPPHALHPLHLPRPFVPASAAGTDPLDFGAPLDDTDDGLSGLFLPTGDHSPTDAWAPLPADGPLNLFPGRQQASESRLFGSSALSHDA